MKDQGTLFKKAELEAHCLDIEKNGKLAQGKTEYLRYLRGEKLSRKEAMLARCYDCMGYFVDGRADCVTFSCPMYPFMIFRGKKINKGEADTLS
jgi:hypothetical protein